MTTINQPIDLSKCTVAYLKNLCKLNNIKGCTNKPKQKLLEILTQHQQCANITATSSNSTILNTNKNGAVTNNIKTVGCDENNFNYTFVDLFCGIGGFHHILSKLGCTCVMACDIDKECRNVYSTNFGIIPESDIKKIEIEAIPDFDILCAGFPCQPFSNAGKKQTFNDKRGNLFDIICEITNIKRPKFMFLENVKHILNIDNKKVIKYIMETLKQLGYILQIEMLSPHDYGIPQQRERVYIICVRCDLHNGKQIPLLYNKTTITNLTNFIEPLSRIDSKYMLCGDILNVLNAWDEMIQVFDVGEKISPTILCHEFFREYSDAEFANLPKWKQEYITKNKRIYDKYSHQWNAWYDNHKTLLCKREIYGKLEWQVGTVKENDSIFKYFIQIRQSGIRVKKEKYFPTLVAISQNAIYGKEKRYITPRECANLQSFPSTFVLHANDKHAYKQLGNCINLHNANNIIESTLTMYNTV